MEILVKFFFKSITILATTFTIYSFANWLFPSAEYSYPSVNLDYIYVAIGVALGIIIAWYVVEEFVKNDDLKTVFYVAIIVSFATYTPIGFVAPDFFENRAIQKAHIAPYDAHLYTKAKAKLQELQTKRDQILSQLSQKITQLKQNKQAIIDKRVYELNTMKYKTTQFKERAWGTKRYKEYERIITGYNSPRHLAQTEFQTQLKQVENDLQNESKSSIYISMIASAKKELVALSYEAYQAKVQQAIVGILPTWMFLVLFTAIGIFVEMLSALPLIIKKRVQHTKKKETQPQEEKPSPSIIALPYINNTNVKAPLTEENLLKARYKDVKVGDYLNSKSTLEFDAGDNELNKAMTKLNKKLRAGGFISGATHHKALKDYKEALAYVKAS